MRMVDLSEVVNVTSKAESRAWRQIDKSKPIATMPGAARARRRIRERPDQAEMRCVTDCRGQFRMTMRGVKR